MTFRKDRTTDKEVATSLGAWPPTPRQHKTPWGARATGEPPCQRKGQLRANSWTLTPFTLPHAQPHLTLAPPGPDP